MVLQELMIGLLLWFWVAELLTLTLIGSTFVESTSSFQQSVLLTSRSLLSIVRFSQLKMRTSRAEPLLLASSHLTRFKLLWSSLAWICSEQELHSAMAS